MEERLTDEPVKLEGLDGPDPEVMPPQEGEVDEDLVGLTPSRLKEELARRQAEEERAKKEYERLLLAAREKRGAGDFRGAVSLYQHAAAYGEGDEAEIELWAAYTEDYTSAECFLEKGVAKKFARASKAAREEVIAHMGSKIRAESEEAEAAAAPLRTEVEAGMASRREAFSVNRRYWAVRFFIAFLAFAAMLVGVAVSGSMLYSRPDILMPVLLAVFGVLSFLTFLVVSFFGHKYYVARRLATDNEKLSSTEKGRELAAYEKKIALFTLALEGEEQEEPEEGEDAFPPEDGEPGELEAPEDGEPEEDPEA